MNGVWTRLFKRVTQNIEYKDRISKNYLDNEPPIWEKIIQYAIHKEEVKVEAKKQWSKFVFRNEIQEVEEHDYEQTPKFKLEEDSIEIEPELKLVEGVWVRLFKRVNQ